MIVVYLLELTISFKFMIYQVHHRKLAKFNDLEVVRMAAKMQSALPLRSGQEVS